MEWRRRLGLALWIFGRFLLHVLGATNTRDVAALQLLFKNWQSTHLNWTDYDPCGSSWRGVVCNNSTNSVIRLISNRGDITGTLSSAIGDLTDLVALDLSFNPQLTGEIPKELGRLTNLQYLSLQGCNFYGSVPKELGLLKNMKFLLSISALNMNKLTGSIPPELGGFPNVTWFDIAQNGLTGPLPVSTSVPQNIGLDNLTSVVHMMVENNALTGEIPVEYGNFAALEILRVDNNRVQGTIPATINQIPKLLELHLANNSLVGTLPDFSALKGILLLNVGENVYGPQPFPPGISNLTNLQTLKIDKGFLNGTIPDGLFALPALESVSLSNNQLSGTVTFPSTVKRLKSVNLNGNMITQAIGIVDSFNLSLVGNPVCSDNSFHLSQAVCAPIISPTWNSTNQTCSITCTDGKLRNLELCSCAFPVTIIFQFNAPSFSDISQDRMNTVKANVSYQTLVAPERVTVGGAAWMSSYRLQVIVYVFPEKGKDKMEYRESEKILTRIALHTNASFPAEFGPYSVISAFALGGNIAAKKSSLSKGAVAGISVGAVAVVLAVVAAVTYAMFQKKRADKALSKPFTSWGSMGKSGSAPKLKGARYFSLHELNKATNNFSSANEIGSGGYGKVYKGVLVTGEEVAIKKAEEGSMQGSGEFKTEIELLSRVHHRNLVGLIGFSYEQGSQMLVYEYMASGSLRDHLALLDPNLENVPQSDLIKFVDLALQCVEEAGANRPSMGQVVKQLELLLLIDGNDASGNGFEFSGTRDGSLYDDTDVLSRGNDPEFAYSGIFQSNVLPK
ncbi:hypothetical protein SELMODRAFT_431914 [Selaginella moellendorffii]|uniref:Protein kinase domain-containing protein n=1 Tax=Selaginella moellendorffii TaxID=88036 RepID=D8TED3_SELML|nr:hypothetical protein SELMODRAFT_431914 [Selaginella moellendorffii]